MSEEVSSLSLVIKRDYSQIIYLDGKSNIILVKIGVGGFYLSDPISKIFSQLGGCLK